jgi:predicted nucleic acid-binding protein
VTERIFLDTSVLIRYFAEDDPPRALAAAALVDDADDLVISTGVLLETVHVLRTDYGVANPFLAQLLIQLLSRDNLRLADADATHVVQGLEWSLRASARRIPDAIIAAAARASGCDWIATFDEKFSSPTLPSRLI